MGQKKTTKSRTGAQYYQSEYMKKQARTKGMQTMEAKVHSTIEKDYKKSGMSPKKAGSLSARIFIDRTSRAYGGK